MNPGATQRPAASKTSVFCGTSLPGAAMSAMFSPSRRRSSGASVFDAGSRTRPFLTRSMRSVLCGNVVGSATIVARGYLRGGMLAFAGADDEKIEQRHTDGDAIGDLLENDGLRAVRDFGSDFDAAIHRPGVQNYGTGLGLAEARGIELIAENIVFRRDGRLVQPLGLHPQHDNHVGILDGFLDAKHATNGRVRRPDAFEFARNPHRGAAEREAAAEFSEQMNVGARHAAMLQVAEDGDVEIRDGPQAVADRERIEQA